MELVGPSETTRRGLRGEGGSRIPSKKSNERVAVSICDRGNHDENDGEHDSGLESAGFEEIADDVGEEERRGSPDHGENDELPQWDPGESAGEAEYVVREPRDQKDEK